MDCHDARLLLAFMRRGSDEIDPTERAAVTEHLNDCSECAALARGEQALDRAFGTAMRAVPVPDGLKQRLGERLATHRPRPWGSIATAAALLLLVGSLTAWALRPLPVVNSAIASHVINGRRTEPDQVEAWYRERGVEMVAWPQLDYGLLWTYDVVEFEGQRVPKLIFRDRNRPAVAEMIVLRKDRFNTTDLRAIPGDTPNRILVELVEHRDDSGSDYVYLVGTTEDNIHLFLRPPN